VDQPLQSRLELLRRTCQVSDAWQIDREYANRASERVAPEKAAVAWALFNNFSRKWGGATDGGAVPIFLLISGLVLLALRSCTAETPHYTPRVMLELAYMIVFPTLLAYIFWDVGMRKGKIILLASLSYLIPLLSTLISCAYLRVIPGPSLWLACAMVIGGAAICKRSVAD